MGGALILFDSPGFTYSLAGLATTFINIYSAQGGHWSVTAWVTIITVGLHLLVTSGQTLWYDWRLEKIKTPHDKALAEGTPK